MSSTTLDKCYLNDEEDCKKLVNACMIDPTRLVCKLSLVAKDPRSGDVLCVVNQTNLRIRGN